jgi:hypothetical protein
VTRLVVSQILTLVLRVKLAIFKMGIVIRAILAMIAGRPGNIKNVWG